MSAIMSASERCNSDEKKWDFVEECSSKSFHSFSNEASVTNSERYLSKLSSFVSAKKHLLDSHVDLSTCHASKGFYFHESLDTLSTENYAIVPPIETFMEVPKPHQIEHFYKSLERGVVVTGVIHSIVDSGFHMNLLAVDVGQARDVSSLKLSAFCPVREIGTTNSHGDDLDLFVVKDKVRAVIVKVFEDKITVSLQSSHLPLLCGDIKLGIVTEEELSLYYSRTIDCQDKSYVDVLRGAAEYENPSNIANLALVFGLCNLEWRPSLMEGLFKANYRPEDYAERLRKSQSHRLAMANVKEALTYFKESKYIEAMQMANKALEVDTENVEAYVVRGALYANSEGYVKAIENFECALKHDPKHSNAQKYLSEVLLAHAKNLMSESRLSSAKRFLDRAEELNGLLLDREASRTISDMLREIKSRKDHNNERNEYNLKSPSGLGNSADGSHVPRDRRKSSLSSQNAISVKYYSPVYLEDEVEEFGPELPPTVSKGKEKTKKRRRTTSHRSVSSEKGKSSSAHRPSKKRKNGHRVRSSSSCSSSSSSSTTSSSTSSATSSTSSSSSSSCKKKKKSKHSKRQKSKEATNLKSRNRISSNRSGLKLQAVKSESSKKSQDSGYKPSARESGAKTRIQSQTAAPLRTHHIENDELKMIAKKLEYSEDIGCSSPRSSAAQKETTKRAGPGESLEDMEMFLKQLKQKKSTKD